MEKITREEINKQIPVPLSQYKFTNLEKIGRLIKFPTVGKDKPIYYTAESAKKLIEELQS